jgi:hypothetical protein
MTARPFSFTVTAPSTIPSWYPAVGVVAQIPGTGTIGTAVRAMGANSYPGIDPDNIVAPWCGGALVYVSSQPYLVALGGGHGDSSFNGMIKFGPLYGTGGSTPTWSQFLAPSPLGTTMTTDPYSDGRQPSVHTYNKLIGVNDRLYAMETNGRYPMDGSQRAYYFTPAGQVSIGNNPSTGAYGNAAYYNGKLYYIGGNTAFDRLRMYTIATSAWSSESNADIALGNYVNGAVDTTRGALLVVASGSGGSTSGAYWTLGTMVRRTGITAAPASTYAMAYDPDRDAFVSYVSGSRTVYEASASALAAGSNATWVLRTFTGATPPASPAAGTYGRFQYVPELKGYVVTPNLETATYFFRSA